jgi:hypothetical protein
MGLYCVSKLVLDKHLIPFLGKPPIDSITSLQIEKYKAQKSNEGLKNKTINNHLTILHKCLRDAKEWLDLEMIPKIKKLKVDPSKTDFLIQEECELLLRNTDAVGDVARCVNWLGKEKQISRRMFLRLISEKAD